MELSMQDRLNKIWSAMKQRCYNTNNSGYPNYGGRGITICDEWLDANNGLVNFRNWAMSNGYNDNLSIDRIDNNKGYSPDNCRWADAKTQSRNRRTNHLFTVECETKTLIEWCEIYGIDRTLIRDRLRRGWDPELAITTPPLSETDPSRYYTRIISDEIDQAQRDLEEAEHEKYIREKFLNVEWKE
jgi:hypothetical protein